MLRAWVVVVIGLSVASILGCGGGKSNQPTELDILKMLEASQTGHDPVNFEEVDLGEFFVTRESHGDNPLFVRFQAFAVVHRENRQKFEESLGKYQHTLRDAIRAKVQEISPDYLNDAKLDWLRNQLRPMINQVLQSHDCRDVIFPSWELEEPIQS